MAKTPDSFVKARLNAVSSQSSEERYEISRDLLARMVAAHTSGTFNAIPEQEDFDHADAMIALLESRLSIEE